MKKILCLFSLIIIGIKSISQIGNSVSAIADSVKLENALDEKSHLIRNAKSPFKTKLSSLLTNISLSSTFNEGENAEAKISYATNVDSTFIIGGFVNQKIDKNVKRQTSPFSFTDGLSSGTTVGFTFDLIFSNAPSFKRFAKATELYAEQKEIKIDKRSVTLANVKGGYDKKTKFNGYGLLKSDERKLLSHNKYHAPIFFKFKVAFTKTSFSFATDSVTLKKTDANHITPQVEFSTGKAIGIKSYLALSYAFSENYNAGDDITLSARFGTTANLYSQTLAFGSPEKKTDNKLSIQWSKLFGDSSNVGISPTFTYGITSEKAAITLPVYFIKGLTKDGKPNGLQGGLQLGYITKTNSSWASFKDGFSAQLIIGVPFALFAK